MARPKAKKSKTTTKVANKKGNQQKRSRYRNADKPNTVESKSKTPDPVPVVVTKAKKKKNKKKVVEPEEEIDVSTFKLDEMDYENAPRTFKNTAKPVLRRMPVKDMEGTSGELKAAVPEPMDVDASDDDEEEEDEVTLDENEQKKDEAKAELSMSPKEASVYISRIAEAITTEPEKFIGSLNRIFALYGSEDATVQRMAMAACTEIFLDLIPSYRIRSMQENHKHVASVAKVTKETKLIWAYESLLLSKYRRHVANLKKCLGAISRKHQTPKSMLALKCASTLLSNAFHFNCSKDLVTMLVPFLKNRDPVVSTIVFNAVSEVFEADTAGAVSLEIVMLIRRFVTADTMNCNPMLLKTLINLPLHARMADAGVAKEISARKARANPRKKGKKSDFEKSVEADLAQAETEISGEKKLRVQAKLLENVFWLYFKILKDGDCMSRSNETVLGFVLEGMGKFCSLINVDLLLDCVEYLKVILNTGGHLSVMTQVYCVLSCLRIVNSGDGENLVLDLKQLHAHVFKLLGKFRDGLHVSREAIREALPLVLRCIEQLFISSRRNERYIEERIMAIAKRLLEVSCHVEPDLAVGCIHVVALLCNKYSGISVLLKEQGSAHAVYRPELHDPDLVKASAASGWEIGLTNQNYHETVRNYTKFWTTDSTPPGIYSTTAEQLITSYSHKVLHFKPAVTFTNASKSKEKRLVAHIRRLRKEVPLEGAALLPIWSKLV